MEMIRDSVQVWPGSSVPCDAGWNHVLVCLQLVPRMDWEVREAFVNMSGSLMLLCEAFLSLHRANGASSEHGGPKLIGLLRDSWFPRGGSCPNTEL